MKVAFISDIHGNLEALSSVFRDIDSRGDIEFIYCTGDVVGYYPHPIECTDLVRKRCTSAIKWNHDEVVTDRDFKNKIAWFNRIAADALTWTRKQLSHSSSSTSFHYLESLPSHKEIIIEERRILLAHGTPEDKWEYFLYPFRNSEPSQVQKSRLHNWLHNWELVVIGHTHQPFIYKFRKKVVLNPGSVGQPRDGIPKASYAVVEINKSIIQPEVIRIDFDIKKTCEALDKADLHDYLCLRLFTGN